MSQHNGGGFKQRQGLAAKSAPDLHGDDLELAGRQTEQGYELGPNGEMSLGRGPQGDPAVGLDPRGAGLGFQIALVDHLGRIRFLNNRVGRFESGLNIASGIDHMGRNITRLVGLFLGRLFKRVQVFMHERSVRLHGLEHVFHDRQRFVVNVNQSGRFLGNKRVGGGHRGHDLTVVANLVRGHDDLTDGAHVDADFPHQGGGGTLWQGGEIVRGNDGFHAGQRFGPAGINLPDAGMGIRATNKFRPQHAGQIEVGPIGRLARDPLRGVNFGQRRSNHTIFSHAVPPRRFVKVPATRPEWRARFCHSPCSDTDYRKSPDESRVHSG